MVLLGKIYPLNNDGYTTHLKNINTSLIDAGYFCGRSSVTNYRCYNWSRENIYEGDCKY